MTIDCSSLFKKKQDKAAEDRMNQAYRKKEMDKEHTKYKHELERVVKELKRVQE